MEEPKPCEGCALRDGHLAALDSILLERLAEISSLKTKLALVELERDRLAHALRVHRRERSCDVELMLPGIEVSSQSINNVVDDEEAEAKPRRQRKRRPVLQLREGTFTELVRELPTSQASCHHCGFDLVKMSHEDRVVIEREPVKYTKLIYRRWKMGCNRCRQSKIVIAPPAEPTSLGAGHVGDSLAIDIALSHAADHLPFYRLAGIYAREGLEIDRSTLGRVLFRLAGLLEPVVQEMKQSLFQSDSVLGIDGTSIKILAKDRCVKRGVYTYHNPAHILYDIFEEQSAPTVLKGLERFKGVMIGDAASIHRSAFARQQGLQFAFCHAHARRYFFEAKEHDPERASVVMRFYRKVAMLERSWEDLEAHERLDRRTEQLRPLFEEHRRWLALQRAQPGLAPTMLEAIEYSIRHWDGLCRLLRDGRIPWTNNASERILRHVAIGRNNWIFRGSRLAASKLCTLWSLIMSCKLHRVDPRVYLTKLLEALSTTSHRELADWTPAAWAQRQTKP